MRAVSLPPKSYAVVQSKVHKVLMDFWSICA